MWNDSAVTCFRVVCYSDVFFEALRKNNFLIKIAGLWAAIQAHNSQNKKQECLSLIHEVQSQRGKRQTVKGRNCMQTQKEREKLG